jgi:hypothetical protein
MMAPSRAALAVAMLGLVLCARAAAASPVAAARALLQEAPGPDPAGGAQETALPELSDIVSGARARRQRAAPRAAAAPHRLPNRDALRRKRAAAAPRRRCVHRPLCRRARRCCSSVRAGYGCGCG